LKNQIRRFFAFWKGRKMTEYEFEYWQEVTQNSKYRWMEDAITRLNGNGTLFYTGGEEGVYMRVSPENKLTVGIYEDAFPHIGDALFKIIAEHQYDSANEAFQAVLALGGKQFLADMCSDDGVKRTFAEPEEPGFGGFEMKM
jgi:hypothetical protein